ncbi:unnamed protein product [Dibothriocephalus latus]|uniref:E3 ubiquitin ligase UBR4 C-terminal domain-containing protein n=1 Tax=Dibothriocephalus latus TaxID=60516 RepID=A0A3P7LBC2_DIBLA|nr:unnamed protein product [Dibothriocephalus latus]
MGRVPLASPLTTPAAAPDSAPEKAVSVTKSPKALADMRKTLDSTFATYMAKFSSSITSIVSFTLNTRLALQDIKLLLLRFAHGRSFHGETGGGARESNLNLLPYMMQDIVIPSVNDASASDESESWRSALSEYIRASDEELLNATPKLLSFLESDLSPVESIAEFLDVIGVIGDVDPGDLEQLAFSGKVAS